MNCISSRYTGRWCLCRYMCGNLFFIVLVCRNEAIARTQHCEQLFYAAKLRPMALASVQTYMHWHWALIFPSARPRAHRWFSEKSVFNVWFSTIIMLICICTYIYVLIYVHPYVDSYAFFYIYIKGIETFVGWHFFRCVNKCPNTRGLAPNMLVRMLFLSYIPTCVCTIQTKFRTA